MSTSVLIIDDDSSIRDEVKRVLRETGIFDTFYEAGDGVDGFKTLLNRNIDLVLCDVEMPGIDGVKFLTMKKSRHDFNDIPVIMLTSLVDVKTKVLALELGANDYVTKPFEAAELVARAKVHIKIKKLQDELKEKNKKLEELSNTDGLTKIFNRRYFMELFELEFVRSERYDTPFSFIMIDIDHFKNFNDSFGHLLGDRILVEVVNLLKGSLRINDQIGRYGGEEFALMMPETDLEGARIVAERHRKRVDDFVMFEGGEELRVTISLGVASFPHPTIKTPDHLIKRADDALLKAKSSGRNKIGLPED